MSFFKELKQEFSKIDITKYHHAHLYFIFGIISMTLFFVSLVQAVIIHVDGFISIALLEYFISSLLLLITIQAFGRGHSHYKYPHYKK